MTDVILLAVIVAFFAAAALLVGVIDRMIAHAGDEAGAPGEDGAELEPRSGR
jgi:hypothetical protein